MPPAPDDATSSAGTRPASRRRPTGPQLTVIRWRDIPAQVIARDGGRTEKLELHQRFQVAIDRAAVKAGLDQYDLYIGEWRQSTRSCGSDLAAEVAAEAARIEAAHPRDAPAALVARGGLAKPQTTARSEPEA